MTWIILLQLGTPESLDSKSIKRYLKEFLMDPRVLNMPFIIRYVLVNWIIIPRRTKKVLKRYALIWDQEKGSPLKYYGDQLTEKLESKVSDDIRIFHSMRYGSSSIQSILENAKHDNPHKIIFVPLFPHETEATTGSIKAEVKRVIFDLKLNTEIQWLPVFEWDESYLETMASRLKKYDWKSFDQVVFSFHGLPLKQIERDHEGSTCNELECANTDNKSEFHCYTRSCYSTAYNIAKIAGMGEENFTIAFQSRFGKRWIGRQTEDIIIDIAKQGKSVLVMAPSFMTDCLETSWEVGIYFKELFEERSSAKFGWTPALNDDPAFVKLLHNRISN